MPKRSQRLDSHIVAHPDTPRKPRARKATTPLLSTPTEISLTLVLGQLTKAQDALAVAASDAAAFARDTDLLQNIAVEIALDIRETCSHTHAIAETVEAWLRMERNDIARLMQLAERQAA